MGILSESEYTMAYCASWLADIHEPFSIFNSCTRYFYSTNQKKTWTDLTCNRNKIYMWPLFSDRFLCFCFHSQVSPLFFSSVVSPVIIIFRIIFFCNRYIARFFFFPLCSILHAVCHNAVVYFPINNILCFRDLESKNSTGSEIQ